MRKARKSKREVDWVAYKRLRNYCTNLIKRAKTSFHQNLLNENTGNPQKFWSAIKAILPSKSFKSQNTTDKADRQERVNNFSDYFKNAILSLKQIAMPLPNLDGDMLNHQQIEQIKSLL